MYRLSDVDQDCTLLLEIQPGKPKMIHRSVESDSPGDRNGR
jgi:hypothetical protein